MPIFDIKALYLAGYMMVAGHDACVPGRTSIDNDMPVLILSWGLGIYGQGSMTWHAL